MSNRFYKCVWSQQNYKRGRDAPEVEGLKAHPFWKWLLKWAVSHLLFCIVLVLIDSEVDLGALLLRRSSLGEMAVTADRFQIVCMFHKLSLLFFRPFHLSRSPSAFSRLRSLPLQQQLWRHPFCESSAELRKVEHLDCKHKWCLFLSWGYVNPNNPSKTWASSHIFNLVSDLGFVWGFLLRKSEQLVLLILT